MEYPQANLIGLEMYEKLFGEPNGEPLIGLREFTINHLFANVWSREEKLSMRHRSMITVALLAAQGRESELKRHIQGALHIGISQIEIREIMIHVAHYAGWAAGHSGERVTMEVFGQPGKETRKDEEAFHEFVRLNVEIGEKERAGNTEYFQNCLADNLTFRRASGEVVTKAEYLNGLKTVNENPYIQLDTSIENVTVNGDSAVVDILVTAQRKSQQRPGVYRNIRMFEKKQGQWQLVH